MIIDAVQFQSKERPYWEELEKVLDAIDRDGAHQMSLEQAQRFHYLYRRTASDLHKLKTLPSEVSLHEHLSSLVGRAYAEIHATRTQSIFGNLIHWFHFTLPQTFRRQSRSFLASLLLTMMGAGLGAGVILFDYDAKMYIFPQEFGHLSVNPSERVSVEESGGDNNVTGHQASFSAMLMVNNIRVSIFALALGMTFGVGTFLLLFYNGVIIGGVVADYMLAGESTFLAGWLLPHGSVEIPAILIAGQAGLMLGFGLIGWGNSLDLRTRLHIIRRDLVTLIFAIILLLIWAGIIEAFFSQYHEPYLPYWLKISFGSIQLFLLFYYLYRVGRTSDERVHP